MCKVSEPIRYNQNYRDGCGAMAPCPPSHYVVQRSWETFLHLVLCRPAHGPSRTGVTPTRAMWTFICNCSGHESADFKLYFYRTLSSFALDGTHSHYIKPVHTGQSGVVQHVMATCKQYLSVWKKKGGCHCGCMGWWVGGCVRRLGECVS